eukprot:CAMPEP_0202372268 /NCGR_PEP_ID=MMETSP1127-20130417/3487_1 /ASSEMBLY_ACC=CAM_ASM_000462 /TAXON_ID=3047 /ORGANISM="Dunaliella tertiolecta, Strain CCMP1320" /LENGTH=624 /DNA_ID=CAMNT_0048968743 /DNA_START=13 /DNA_END=1884 /DNA_ORIENTATION=+
MSESSLRRGGAIPHGLPQALWHSALETALASLHSPFVVALASGSLPKSAFQFYVAQDATFLSSFGDAYKAAISKAHTAGSVPDVKPRLERLLQGVQEELQLHGSYAAKWGIDLNQGFIPSPATTAYTDYLHAVAHAEDASVADILAAMAPCSRLYAWLGCTLADAYPGASHQYVEWIETYSSEGYMALPDIKEGLLHELTSDQPPPAATFSIAGGLRESCMVSAPRPAYPIGSTQQQKFPEVQEAWFARLQPLYHQAMCLERDFFYAQPDTPPFRVVKALVVSFDGSCCEGSALAAQQQQQHQQQQHQPSTGDKGMEIQAQVDAFSVRHADKQAVQLQLLDHLLAPNVRQQQHQQDQQHGCLLGRRVDGQLDHTTQCDSGQGVGSGHQGPGQASTHFDRPGLDRFLKRLREAERGRRQDLSHEFGSLKGVLSGLPSEELRRSAQRLPLKQGCKQALQHARDLHVPLHVVSESWPSSLVAGALGLNQFGQNDEQQQQECKGAPVVASQSLVYVHANGPEQWMDSDSFGVSRAPRCVQNPQGKDSALTGLLSHTDNKGGPGMTVYVGGCVLDLGAMLGADCGVVIGEDEAFERVAACYGVQVRQLVTAPLKIEDCVPGVVYKGSSW